MRQVWRLPTWAWVWMIIALCASSVPVIAGLMQQNSEASFSGLVINEEDTNTYFANMQEGRYGDWLYTMPYNSPPSTAAPLFMFYIVTGHVSRILHISIPFLFHILRVLCGAAFAITSFAFIAQSTPHESERKFAFAMLLFTGGLGWLVVFSAFQEGKPPVDFWFLDGYGYTILMGMPHFSLNVVFMVLMLLCGSLFMRESDARMGITAALCGLGIAFLHPHQLAIIALTLGILRLRELFWREALRLSLFLIHGGFVALASALIIRGDPYLSSWAEQGDTYTFPVPEMLIAYGLLFPLALFGLWKSRDDSRMRLAAIWFVVGFILMYVPVNFQRRFAEGWHLPLVLLASMGWHRAARIPKNRWLLGALFATAILTPIILTLATVLRMNTSDPVFFVSADEQGALTYLDEHGDLDTVVLSSYERGNNLAARVGVRSFIGHWSLTAFVDEKLEVVDTFFSAETSPEERQALLREYNVRYVFYSDTERKIGDFSPDDAPYLILVYESPTISLYAVRE